jgi:hypothetical protein
LEQVVADFEQLLRRAIDAARNGDTDFRVLIESEEDPDKWVQLSWDAINAAYPLSQDPSSALPRLGLPLYEGFEVIEWEPNRFATFGHSTESIQNIATFLSAYMSNVLELDANHRFRVVEE